MPLDHFEMEQRVRILRHPHDKRLVGRLATIVKINYDGTALARIDGERGVRVTGKTIWPEDCDEVD